MLTIRSERAFADYCSAVKASVLPVQYLRINKDEPFRSEVISHKFGPVDVTETFLASGTIGRMSPAPVASCTPQFFILNIRRSGSVLHSHYGNAYESTTGTMSIFDSRNPFETRQLSATRSINLRVSGSLLRKVIGNPEDFCGRPINLRHGVAAVFREFVHSMWMERNRISESEGRDLAFGMIDLLKGVCAGLPVGTQASVPAAREPLMRRIEQHIERHLSDHGLTVESIARALQVPRSRLYAASRGASNTLGQLILEKRLDRCRQALVNSRLKSRRITEIAADWGFGSVAHFSRAFKARYGVSPVQFRNACESVPNPD
jgi:AraC-like DNA-binding protein